MRNTLWPEADQEQNRKETSIILPDADRYEVVLRKDRPSGLIGTAGVSWRSWAEV